MAFGSGFFIGILAGIISGIIATLIASNPNFTFHVEKAIRKVLRKPLLTVRLVTFTNFCSDGFLLIHCVEIRNNMWLNTIIPRVYCMSTGKIPYDSRAYKPFCYFRSSGLFGVRTKSTIDEVLNEYSKNIVGYTPSGFSLGINLSRGMPLRVAVICESIRRDAYPELNISHPNWKPLNHMKVVGDICAAIADPTPLIPLGSWWDLRVISEDFGEIDKFRIEIPKDLKEREPLGSTSYVLEMKERPPCLLDIGLDHFGFNWLLRFD